MSPLHLVHWDRTPAQPWANGGGLTRALLTWPAPAGGDWQLRVSVAEITQDGPFSALPGLHRGFAVLRGAGVALQWPGQPARQLRPDSAPLQFDGDPPPGCQLLDGPTQDLNLMVRASTGRAGLARADAAHRSLVTGPRWRGLYLAEGEAWLQRGAEPAQWLQAGTLAWSSDCPQDWQLDSAQTAPLAWWLWLAPEASS